MKNNLFFFKKSGFTLIEMLVFIFIFSIVSLAFYKVMTTGIQVALDSKNRLGALALANERMEIARNLKYEDVGTIGGIPNGVLPETETVSANGISYEVKTSAKYEDDDLDGVYPADTVPEDYKVVRISVSWGSQNGGSKEVSLVSRFVPPGLEVGSGDGLLSVHVINSAGTGIPDATVHIVNNSISPSVNITQETDNSGNLIFPGAVQSIYSYALTVTKDGYETINTIDPTSVNYSHIDVHASVITGLLNTKSIIIDLVSDLSIRSVDQVGAVLPDVSFHLKGGRILGIDNVSIPSKTIYINDLDSSTGSSGESKLEKQGPGQFFITNIISPSGYTLVGLDPIASFDASVPSYSFSLMPGIAKTVEMKFAENSKPGLIVRVKDNAPGNALISGADVKLFVAGGYEGTDATSFDGVAFFSDNAGQLIDGEYDLEVKAAGFQDYSGKVTVENLTTEEIKLTSI